MPSHRILIIDDDPSVAGLIREMLQGPDLQYVVDAVHKGSEGLAHLARQRPDLVLLDVRMPGLDGITVLRYLRKISADIPVIMISGGAQFGDARVHGAFACVVKPFNRLHLQYLVRTALATSEARKSDRAASLGDCEAASGT